MSALSSSTSCAISSGGIRSLLFGKRDRPSLRRSTAGSNGLVARADTSTIVRLSVITDEIDPSLGRALDVCEELDVDAVELRFLDGVQVVDLGPRDLEAIRTNLDGRGFAVSAIASPFLKCDRGEPQDDVLAGTLQAARILRAPIVRAFAYWREADPGAALPDAGRALRDAAERAHAAGTTLAL